MPTIPPTMSRAHTLATLALLTARAAAAPSPSCMMNGNPCPVPDGWAVDWSLRNSTIAMPELAGALNNLSFVPAPGHHWGMVRLTRTTLRAPAAPATATQRP
jgi:hypothetical protein